MTLEDIVLEDRNALSLWEGLINVAHLWDDLIDKDAEITEFAVHDCFYFLCCELPLNPFYNAYKNQLQPVINHACLSYIASANMERDSKREDLSHVLRYELGAVIVQIALIIRGKEFVFEHADEIWQMIVDDSLEKYQQERKLCLASSD